MEQIRKVNEYSMIKADAFANATLVDGREKITSWFDDFSLIDFTRPFFRTTTGKDTYFVIDSEIISANISRELSLKIILEFWENWKEKNQDYNFFWKISGVGIHAMQYINDEINPMRFKKVFEELFPQKSGWKKSKKYLFHNYQYDSIDYKIGVDLDMTEYPKLIRWVYSPYWKIKNEEYFSIPIKKWDISKILDDSVKSNLKIENFSIPEFQFFNFLSPNIKSRNPGFKNRYWKTNYDLNIPNVGENLSGNWIISMKKIKDILEDSPYCIKKAIQLIKSEKKSHYKRVIILKYLQNKGFTIEEIATFFRFYLNSTENNKEPWKICFYCNYYFKNPHKFDLKTWCKFLNDPKSIYYVCDRNECLKNKCKYL
ncbi:MAG: hypothetical protein ACTSYZ_14070 [Candidatus Helarchaeota archaeon]